MSYHKDDKDLELDNMNIKTHLNTSLNLDGISVSEDLINRTLEAIHKQQAGQQDMKETVVVPERKVIPWSRYIRTAATVAAAVILVVAGYSVISRNSFKGKEDKTSYDTESSVNEEYSMKSAAADNAVMEDTEAPEAADAGVDNDIASASIGVQEFAADSTEATDERKETANNTTEDEAVTNSAPLYTITASKEKEDSAKQSVEEETAEGGTENKSSDLASDTATSEALAGAGVTSAAKAASKEVAGLSGDIKASINTGKPMYSNEDTTFLTFRDIFLPNPEQAQYVMITDETNKTSINLTDQQDILDFYEIMDQQQFTYNTESSVDQNYTVEVKSPKPEETIYTMQIGSVVTVQYTTQEYSSQGIYNATDIELLKQKLDEFYQKYKQ